LKEWEWEKTLSIACALYRKFKDKENHDMALDPNRQTRDYLFGRLLAIADRLEGVALYKSNEKRDTNAARYMQQFAERPNKTWRLIELSLSPYMARLGGANFFKRLIDEVMCKFDPIEDFNSDKPLSGEFLIGYHCQRAELQAKAHPKDKDGQSSDQKLDIETENNN
jgi:CRISPR-associated protein Csd1